MGLKAEGVTPGVADLILLVPRGGHNALCLEMKTPTGRQSPAQKEWQRVAQTFSDVRYEICRSFNGFQDIVNEYLNMPDL